MDKAEHWNVYVIKGANGTLYTGITTSVERRLAQHNGFEKGGARATRAHRPYTLVYVEVVSTRSEALKREYAIKCLPKHLKEKLFLRRIS